MKFERIDLFGEGGPVVIDLEPHTDVRGFFARTFCEEELSAHGLPTRFPQCNLSRNTVRGTLRGMHYNVSTHAEAKLVRCSAGAVYDVVADLRAGSASRLRWFGVELTAKSGRALFVPEGFAHGFITLRDDTDVHYHMGRMFRPEAARGFRYNDPRFAIEWPLAPILISARDATYPDFDPAARDA